MTILSDNTVGTVAKEAGVSPKVIRYYISQGLIALDDTSAAQAVHWIKHMKRAGFSLAEIKTALPSLLGTTRVELQHVYDMADKHRVAIEQMILRLQKHRVALVEFITDVETTEEYRSLA
jgi:DNA-binding transcriptional MerR regulator